MDMQLQNNKHRVGHKQTEKMQNVPPRALLVTFKIVVLNHQSSIFYVTKNHKRNMLAKTVNIEFCFLQTKNLFLNNELLRRRNGLMKTIFLQ